MACEYEGKDFLYLHAMIIIYLNKTSDMVMYILPIVPLEYYKSFQQFHQNQDVYLRSVQVIQSLSLNFLPVWRLLAEHLLCLCFFLVLLHTARYNMHKTENIKYLSGHMLFVWILQKAYLRWQG